MRATTGRKHVVDVSLVRSLTSVVLVHILLTGNGCAVHYFDTKSGTEHLWGIGHMAMKPGSANEGLKAVGHRTDIVGVSIGKLREGVHFEIGWGSEQRVEI